MNRRVNTAVAITIPSVLAIFYVDYLWNKCTYILTPAYTGTCYQTGEYLSAYMSGILVCLLFNAVISLVMGVKFIDAMPRNFALLLLVSIVVTNLAAIEILTPGSC